MQNILDNLNDIQKEAVLTTEGPLLLLAGAGTGKTKVLTSRIANIVLQKLAWPSEILAVTFTNKAAFEMKERISYLLAGDINDWWVGTFHGIGLRILRKFYAEAGLQSKFIILDPDDGDKLLKQIMEELNIDPKTTPIKYVSNTIARLKDKGITPVSASSSGSIIKGNDQVAKIYSRYQERLKEINSVDFGDLLMLCVELFKNNHEVLAYYQNKFKYILVDEYQDTNAVQYAFLRALALKNNNICCVGDDDQSIYSWRGAEISNILKFSDDYLGAKVLRLEQNYRSTSAILGAASSLIANNQHRHGKKLWTAKEGGTKVIVKECLDSNSEAKFIMEEIAKYYKNGLNYNEIAVLVRAGYQTREIEDKLVRGNIPYKIIGGNKFYERLEIKDSVAYLRLCYQLNDDMAFLRIINTPRRGIGAATITKIRDFASSERISLLLATKLMLDSGDLTGKSAGILNDFTSKIILWNSLIDTEDLPTLAETILNESGYINMWRDEHTEESKARLDNINELLNSLVNYDSMEKYLEHISLVMGTDDLENSNKVSLMTLHSAKGLEFPLVFLSGWEEGLFPSARSVDESGDKGLEEERRLAYVGITRAKQYAVISYSLSRIVYGGLQNNQPSRFIKEIDKEHVQFSKQQTFTPNFNNANSLNFNNSSSFAKPATVLAKGTRVMHDRFGYGLVIKQDGPLAVVEFEDYGERKIMANFLNKL